MEFVPVYLKEESKSMIKRIELLESFIDNTNKQIEGLENQLNIYRDERSKLKELLLKTENLVL